MRRNVERLIALISVLCLTCLVLAQAPKKSDGKAAHGKMTSGTVHKMPPRNPKTGRFMKKPPPAKAHSKMTADGKMSSTGKSGKKLPPRDPKTGRFMNKPK